MQSQLIFRGKTTRLAKRPEDSSGRCSLFEVWLPWSPTFASDRGNHSINTYQGGKKGPTGGVFPVIIIIIASHFRLRLRTVRPQRPIFLLEWRKLCISSKAAFLAYPQALALGVSSQLIMVTLEPVHQSPANEYWEMFACVRMGFLG